MKKTIFFIIALAIPLGAVFFSQYTNVTERKPLQKVVTVYRDEEYTVLVQGRNILLKKGFKNVTTIPVSENTIEKAERIKNKSEDQLPMKDIAIKNGLLLTGKENIYFISLEPDIRLKMSYPNPGTAENKIIVIKGRNELYFYNQGYLVKKYQVATGKEHYFTPEGAFKIVNKIPYPEGNNPDSLYGTRWMGLAVPDQKDKRANNDARAPIGHKYGIHGTNEPESIGTDASGGCIRLKNEDVEELYSMVPVGTQVEIR